MTKLSPRHRASSRLALLGLLAIVAAPAQTPLLDEDFETSVVAPLAPCGAAVPGVLPPGWSSASMYGTNSWRVWAGPQPYGAFGPFGDHTTGAGRYVMVGSDAECTGTAELVAPFQDCGAGAEVLTFRYRMTGPDPGTLRVVYEDGGTGSAVTAFERTGNQGEAWLQAVLPVPVGCFFQITFVADRFTFGPGFPNPGVIALDDVRVGTTPPERYQENTDDLRVRFDGVEGTAYAPAVSDVRPAACGFATPVSLQVASLHPGADWDLLVSAAGVVPADAGGLVLPDGQRLGIDLSVPFAWLSSGGATPGALALPGGSLPGGAATGVSFSLGLLAPGPSTTSIQAVVTAAPAPLGFFLSQPSRLEVASPSAVQTIAGPLADDGTVVIDVTAAPTCWCPQGVPFFGTAYATLHVSSNGRLCFGSTDDDFTPSLVEAASGPPFAGWWTDLGVHLGGSISAAQSASGSIRIEYEDVPYFGEPGTTSSFAIELDCTTGALLLDGLDGILANPSPTGPGDRQFLGLSPGGGAVDAGPILPSFATLGSGGPTAPLEMIYEWSPATPGGAGLPPSLVAGTITGIGFVPVPGGGYQWSTL